MKIKLELDTPRYINDIYCENVETAIEQIAYKLDVIQSHINNLTRIQSELNKIKEDMSKWRMDVLINE